MLLRAQAPREGGGVEVWFLYHTARSYRRGAHPPSFAIKDRTGENLLTDPREIELRWKEYFETLLNPVENEDIFEIDFDIDGSNEPDFSLNELEKALINMKNGKAPGEDGIPSELLKNMGREGKMWFLDLCKGFWNRGTLPLDLGKDLMCHIYTFIKSMKEC